MRIKFIVAALLIAFVSFVICLYMSWWGIALVAFIVGVIINQTPLNAFLSGFVALFVLWGGLAWIIDIRNDQILSHKMASLLPFAGSSFLMIMATALIGALIAGGASLSGHYLKDILPANVKNKLLLNSTEQEESKEDKKTEKVKETKEDDLNTIPVVETANAKTTFSPLGVTEPAKEKKHGKKNKKK